MQHTQQARVQEFVRGGAQNLKAFFFFFAFQFLGGPRPLGPPPPGHAPAHNVIFKKVRRSVEKYTIFL